MAHEEASCYCGFCQRPVLGRRDKPAHLIHFIITFFSCGLWGIIWLIAWLSSKGNDFACPTCGGRAEQQRA